MVVCVSELATGLTRAGALGVGPSNSAAQGSSESPDPASVGDVTAAAPLLFSRRPISACDCSCCCCCCCCCCWDVGGMAAGRAVVGEGGTGRRPPLVTDRFGEPLPLGGAAFGNGGDSAADSRRCWPPH